VVREQIIAFASGAAQPNISDQQVLDCCIPIVAHNAQKYIGNKVRQAERLRANSLYFETKARTTMSSYLPQLLPDDFHQRPRKVESKFTTPVSLGAEYGRAQIGHRLFKDSLPLRDLIESCKCGDAIEKSARVAGSFHYYGASGPIDRHDEYNFDGEYLIVAQDGTIGCAFVARGKFWANNHTWILKVKPEFDPDSIAVYLADYYPFWKGMTTGSVVPKVTSENLLSIVVPVGIASSSESIGYILRTAEKSRFYASQLVLAAKLLVDVLIDLRLSEDELVDAQAKLEQGDDSADRAILSRLYEGGLDAIETRQLFPDLDTFYETLRMVERQKMELTAT
jgi:type I restriction enzyme S subunit